ncbi:MAG: shikimate kinase [Opitutales bacterium]
MTDGSQALGPNLYLVGFMASGKTTAGRNAARKLDYRFIDSDQAIEEKASQPITEIFSEQGEQAFRAMERNFMESGHPLTGCVVACGGGLVVPPGMAELVASKGVSICLSATPETILSRTQGRDNRPLLNVPDPEKRIRELLDERNPRYQAVGNVVSTDDRTMAEVAAHVLRVYRDACAKRG